MARKLYLGIASSYSKPSGRDILHDDLLIANSHWSAALVQECRGVKCADVIYPPVWTEFPEVPWEEKEQAFAMIGRIAPEKQIERTINILEAVRRRGHLIRLHLCGQIESDPYGRRIEQICREQGDWIVLEGRVSGAKKTDILTHCRFGIHTRTAEPFGISVAEMMRAGAIVFAPMGGGQAEILDCSNLLFSSDVVAVEKIGAVLENLPLQSALRAHLTNRAKLFSAEIFARDVRALVASSLAPNRAHSLDAMSSTV